MSAAGPHPEFLRLFAQTRRFTLGYPTRITPTPDGSAVLFLRSGPREAVLRLYEFDVASGTTRELVTPEALLGGAEEELSVEERARRERMRITARGFTTFDLSRDGRRVLLPLSGRLFVYERATSGGTDGSRRARELGDPDRPPAIDPRFSPDGARVGLVRDHDVHVVDIASGREWAVTTGGTETVSHGLAEFVAQEEMGRFEGYWWSPDGAWIAFEAADNTEVERFSIADPAAPERPATVFPYPRPGKANARVRLGVVPVGNGSGAEPGKPVWIRWDAERYPYLARVLWSEQAPLTLLVQSRDQREAVLLAADHRTGETRPLHVERDEAWVSLDRDLPRWLPDGSGFLIASERTGRRELNLHRVRRTTTAPRSAGQSWPAPSGGTAEVDNAAASASDGLSTARHGPAAPLPEPPGEDQAGADETARVLVPGEASFLALVHVAPDAGALYVLTGTPITADLWRVPIAPDRPGGAPPPLVPVPGLTGAATADRTVVFAHDGSLLVDTRTTVDSAPESVVYRVHDGSVEAVGVLPATAEPFPFRPNVELLTVRGESGRDYHAALVRPRDFAADRRYPVIVSVYGGPGALTVQSSERQYLLPGWFADHGVVVVLIDNRGTPRRERAWKRAIKGSFGEVPLADQVEALAALGARYPELDLGRVGIYGWSFGGYMSALAVLRRPDVYRVGVAGAPVVDWHDYDTHYTERYLDLPAANPEGYRQSSLLTYAADLARPLLITHGTADDNVYFFHSLKLADALFRAGRAFEFLPLANVTHQVAQPELVERLYARMADFLLRHLRE